MRSLRCSVFSRKLKVDCKNLSVLFVTVPQESQNRGSKQLSTKMRHMIGFRSREERYSEEHQMRKHRFRVGRQKLQ